MNDSTFRCFRDQVFSDSYKERTKIHVRDENEMFDYYCLRYSSNADKEEIQDDREFLDKERLNEFLKSAKFRRYFKSSFSDEEILNLFNIKKNDRLTKAGAMIFSKYPQMYFPQLSIHAVSYPGNDVGELGVNKERFLDNENITGSIQEMLEQAIHFIKKNLCEKTTIVNGERINRYDYPIDALREALLNALIHRDYSSLSERKPIVLNIFKNRIEIASPGGLFGDFSIEQLGKGSCGVRNENIVNILEILDVCKNRDSGIPIMRKEMRDFNLPEPLFINRNDEFKVVFFNNSDENEVGLRKRPSEKVKLSQRSDQDILDFCSTPRSRQEIKDYFNVKSNAIFTRRILPLVKKKELMYTIPEHPKSPKQKFVSNNNGSGRTK